MNTGRTMPSVNRARPVIGSGVVWKIVCCRGRQSQGKAAGTPCSRRRRGRRSACGQLTAALGGLPGSGFSEWESSAGQG